jgi:hypothetical protein
MADSAPSDHEIETAWRQAKPSPGRDPRLYRIAPDVVQTMIRRDRFNICGEFGWRIEHGRPVAYRTPSIEQAMKLMQQDLNMPDRPSGHAPVSKEKT